MNSIAVQEVDMRCNGRAVCPGFNVPKVVSLRKRSPQEKKKQKKQKIFSQVQPRATWHVGKKILIAGKSRWNFRQCSELWASSETQGQIVGRAGNWSERKRRRRREGAGRKELFSPLLYFSPPLPLRCRFRSPQLPARPTICPWVSEDELWESHLYVARYPNIDRVVRFHWRSVSSILDQ